METRTGTPLIYASLSFIPQLTPRRQTESVYRHLDIFDTSPATDILPQRLTSITTSPTSGTLLPALTPAQYCPFLDFNVNSELNKFGLHNGGADDAGLLNEKWESIAMMPLDGVDGDDDEWLVLALSDNDFVTQDGYIATGGVRYSDASGAEFDSQALVFRVKLPEHSRPFPRGA